MSAAAFVACGSGAYAAPRGRMSAKSGYCSWSCSMRLFISFMNYPTGAVTPTAPSAARLAQIMVPTWGGPCRALIKSEVV